MTAPLNLVLHSVNEEDLVDAMVAAIQTRIPGYQPLEATLDAAMLEAWAIAAGQSVYTLNQLPSVVIDAILQMNGLVRHTATASVGTISITMATGTTGAHILPGGTTFRISPDSADSFDVRSIGTSTWIPSDNLVFTFPVAAVVPGSAPNGTAPGTPVSLVDSLSWVESAALASPMVAGTNGEDNATFYARGSSYLQSRNSTLVVPQNFVTAALDIQGVGRAWVFNNWNGAAGGTPGNAPGHVTVVITTPGGAICLPETQTLVQNTLSANAVASLQIHIINPVFVPVTVTANISVLPGWDSSEVRSRVTAVITSFLSPATRQLGATLSANAMVGLIAKEDGVSVVNTVGGTAIGRVPGILDLPALSPVVTITVS